MTNDPDTAQHLAELEAQHDAHVAALRERTEHASDALADAASELSERLEPPPYPNP